MCWYSDEDYKKNNMKTCMSLYSAENGDNFGWSASSLTNPTEKDFKQNGRYCQSGLAYPVSDNKAKCTSFKNMTHGD